MAQKFESLNPDDVAELEAKRSWVRDVDIYALFEEACNTVEQAKREGA